VLFSFKHPRARKIGNQVSSCPGIFSRTLSPEASRTPQGSDQKPEFQRILAAVFPVFPVLFEIGCLPPKIWHWTSIFLCFVSSDISFSIFCWDYTSILSIFGEISHHYLSSNINFSTIFFEIGLHRSRISHSVSGGGSGSTRTVDAGHKFAPSWNQIQTLKSFLCFHILCIPLCTFVQNFYSFPRSL